MYTCIINTIFPAPRMSWSFFSNLKNVHKNCLICPIFKEIHLLSKTKHKFVVLNKSNNHRYGILNPDAIISQFKISTAGRYDKTCLWHPKVGNSQCAAGSFTGYFGGVVCSGVSTAYCSKSRNL